MATKTVTKQMYIYHVDITIIFSPDTTSDIYRSLEQLEFVLDEYCDYDGEDCIQKIKYFVSCNKQLVQREKNILQRTIEKTIKDKSNTVIEKITSRVSDFYDEDDYTEEVEIEEVPEIKLKEQINLFGDIP